MTSVAVLPKPSENCDTTDEIFQISEKEATAQEVRGLCFVHFEVEHKDEFIVHEKYGAIMALPYLPFRH